MGAEDRCRAMIERSSDATLLVKPADLWILQVSYAWIAVHRLAEF
jgi:hypothetical protein